MNTRFPYFRLVFADQKVNWPHFYKFQIIITKEWTFRNERTVIQSFMQLFALNPFLTQIVPEILCLCLNVPATLPYNSGFLSCYIFQSALTLAMGASVRHVQLFDTATQCCYLNVHALEPCHQVTNSNNNNNNTQKSQNVFTYSFVLDAIHSSPGAQVACGPQVGNT